MCPTNRRDLPHINSFESWTSESIMKQVKL